MKELYKFEKLSEKLDNLNYPIVTESRFEIIRKYKQDGKNRH